MNTTDFTAIFAPVAEHYRRQGYLKQRAFRKARDDNGLIEDDAAALGDGDSNGGGDSHISRLADMIVEAKGCTRAQALDWLLHTKSGQALFARTKRKDTKPVDKMSTLEHFVKNKDGGFISICKHALNGGEVALGEHDFVKLATEAAKRDYPNDRPDKAFSKYFEAHEVVRRAHAIIKALPATVTIMPVITAGGDNDDDDDDDSDALQQLQELAVEQARRSGQPVDKCFAKIYADPAYARLAQKERRQARARLG